MAGMISVCALAMYFLAESINEGIDPGCEIGVCDASSQVVCVCSETHGLALYDSLPVAFTLVSKL